MSIGQTGPISVFTVVNTGTAPLALGSVSVPAGFALVSGLPTSLATGASAIFSVQLTATVAGTYAGTVSFSNNASNFSENPFQFQITGTVVGIPQIAVSGNGLSIADGDTTPQTADGTDFGSPRGATRVDQRLYRCQRRDGRFDPRNRLRACRFYGSRRMPTSLASEASANFSVQLSATAAGTYAGNVSFSNNAAEGSENPYQFQITGTVMGIPGIAISGCNQNIPDGDSTPQATDGTDFGSVLQGQAGTTSLFTVVNTGSVPVALGR